MYDERLVLGEYGDLVTTYETYIDKERVLYLNYKDFEKKIKLEVEFINKSKGYKEICTKNGKYGSIYYGRNSKPGSCTLSELLDVAFEFYDPIKLPYGVVGKRNSFSVKRTAGKYDFDFSFDKDKIVISDGNSYAVYDSKMYKNKDINTVTVSDPDPKEVYKFIDQGYVYQYIDEDKEPKLSIFNNGILFDFGAPNGSSQILIDNMYSYAYIPKTAIVMYSSDNVQTFEISSTINGSMYKVIDKKDPNINFCRYEQFRDVNPIKYRNTELPPQYIELSVFPYLCNMFDPNYTDKPLLYWAENKISGRNDISIIRRNMYRIDQNKLDSLLQKVRSESRFPIIDVYED